MAKGLFHEFDRVRVIRLLQPERNYIGGEDRKRPPRVGDIGVIVDIPPGSTDYFIVECVDSDGVPFWLADFVTDELELVEAQESPL